ncbi:hypothetical protein BDB01DRAFT_835094 [Pilobolus umbonatus]|nr:hypothetical protein BDB01DRAFT_835094 [Pilobolus umbonatus]
MSIIIDQPITEFNHDSTQHEEKDSDMTIKKYENMSYDEISQRMAENYRQITEMLSSTSMISSLSAASSVIMEEQEELDDHKRYTAAYTKATSNGDIERLQELLNDPSIRPYIDLNARDIDGTPPLIYAACFGKIDIARILLEAGAQIDVQDSFGWSALMWATNNNHEALVKILVDYGASSNTKSTKGRTVFDFISNDNQKMIDILATTPRDSLSSTSSVLCRTSSSLSSSSSCTGDSDFYYQSTSDRFDAFMVEESEIRRRLIESTMALVATVDEEDGEEDDNDSVYTDGDLYENIFHWDRCSPDQMFVFNADNLNSILDMIITDITLPMANRQNTCLPTNVIFLSARFAHYFSTRELLTQVLTGSLDRISKYIKLNVSNIHALSFWITNLSQLLYYLKKDHGLVVATAEYQVLLSELISETYNMIIYDTEKRLNKVLGLALLEHEEIGGMDKVEFIGDWHRFFRKSLSRSIYVDTDSQLQQISSSCIAPQSITTLLSSALLVLRSYEVHPIIIIQALAQFFHFISCELFNRILTNKKYLCRSKALQIRMNISQLEDWISINKLPSNLLDYLNPSIQLLQLLQCLTHLRDLVDFINTTKSFDALNAPQIKRCVISYRYEVNEPRLPDEIEKYAMQCAEDTVKHKYKQKTVDKTRLNSRNISISQQKLSRHQSMTQYLGQFKANVTRSTPTVIDEHSIQHTDMDDDDHDIKETKDSRFMLPFLIPNTSQMASSLHSEADDHSLQPTVPIIPEEWLEMIDSIQEDKNVQ